jgi:hypothetical protein
MNTGGADNDSGSGLDVDSAGNVYVTGYFGDTFTFGGATATSNGGQDIFVLQLDVAGTPGWIKTFGGAASDSGAKLAVDSAGNVVVTGNFSSSVDFGDGARASAGQFDIMLLKLDGTSNGDLIAVRTFGAAGDDSGYGVALDGTGGVHLTGWFTGMVTFDAVTLDSGGGSNMFAAKLSP